MARVIPLYGAIAILSSMGGLPAEARQAPGAREPLAIAGATARPEPGPLEKRAIPITPENPIPRRVYFVAPQYPPEAAAIGAQATVRIRLTLDELGRVREMRLTGAPLLGAWAPGSQGNPQDMRAAFGAFIRSATDAVRQWQYDPPVNGPIAFDVAIGFRPDSEPRVVFHGASPATPGPADVTALFPSASSPPPPWAEGVLRVGGPIKPPPRVRQVHPVYPALAQTSRVTGVVILEARIEPDGRVGNARVLRSIPLLDQAALDAVLQWEFEPTLLNGVPVPVLMTVTIQFSLP